MDQQISQLNNIDLDNKELISYYSNQMRNIVSLKIIQMNHTKYQSYNYFSASSFNHSFLQLLRSSKLLFQFRENLFFSLRQMYLKRDSLLSVLQWMSPPFNSTSTRPADQLLLKSLSELQKKGLLGPLPQMIYMIEIERLLKVIQYDQKDITLKILFELTSKMKCYIKDKREYVFYDQFFNNLYHYFKPQENVTDLLNYQKEYEKKLKAEQKISTQTGLRKIGVITEDYKESYTDLDGLFYDSIANLLYAKGKVDYMNYKFMGFRLNPYPKLGINIIYGNPLAKCKLYLRTITLCDKIQQKQVRPQSARLGQNNQQQNKVNRPSSAVVSNQKRIQSAIQQPKKGYSTYHNPILMIHHSDSIYGFCKHLLDNSNKPTLIIDCNIRDCDDEFEGPRIFKKIQKLNQNQMHCIIAYSDSMFGVAKPMCEVDYDSDEEFDDIDVDICEQPIYLKEPVKQEKPPWVSSVGQKKKKQQKRVQQQEASSIIENDGINNVSDIAPMVKMLNIPSEPIKIEFNFAEYEVELNEIDPDVVAFANEVIEVDFSQFGFGSALLWEVYSVNCELVSGLKLSFPDEGVELPLMKFPCIPCNQYDRHSWLIRPIDNIKGIQIQKKKVKEQEFVRNIVLLVQDNERSRLQEYEFDYVARVSESTPLIPELTNEWRDGSFTIYLNFDLKMLSREEIDLVVSLLKKMNGIFESLFPQMIVLENMKKIRAQTVFEVFLQGMGRPSNRDHYDRYYVIQLSNWNKIKFEFEDLVTELIDNLLLLIWSYGGVKNMQLAETEMSKRSTGRVVKSHSYKYIQNFIN